MSQGKGSKSRVQNFKKYQENFEEIFKTKKKSKINKKSARKINDSTK